MGKVNRGAQTLRARVSGVVYDDGECRVLFYGG